MKNDDTITVHMPREKKEIFRRLGELHDMEPSVYMRHLAEREIENAGQQMIDLAWALGERTDGSHAKPRASRGTRGARR